MRGGALDKSITNVTAENFMLWPNLDQIPTISAVYEKMIAEETNNPMGLQQNMETAHKNFLKQAIYFLYEDGREKEAQRWFDYMKSIYTNALVGREASMSMQEFAVSQIATDINEMDMNKVQAGILGMLDQGFICLARDNDAQAQNYMNMARRIRAIYELRTKPAAKDRVALKSIAELQRFELRRLLDPQSGLPPQVADRILTKLGLTRTGLGLPVAPAPAPAAGS
jgi:hypothetical protein